MNAEAKDVGEEFISFIPGQRGRKPADKLPVVRDSNGNAYPRYLVEKHLGIRRENGALKLKRLTARHLKVIALHLEGHSLETIANNIPCTISTVSRVLNDPLSQRILKTVYEDRKGEIHALGGKAVAAVRAGLDEKQTIGTRLRAVDRFAKIKSALVGEENSNESAEDVIARMFANTTVLGNVNIQVNQGKKEE